MTEEKRKPGFERKIFPRDILSVLDNQEIKTSEVVKRLQETEKGKKNKKYKTVSQDGVLKVLKKMAENGDIEGDIERFGFWMWKNKTE